MQRRWKEIYQLKEHSSETEQHTFEYDSEGSIQRWLFSERDLSPKMCAALEVAICWHVAKKVNLFRVSARELENYLRDQNHEPILTKEEINELEEKLIEIKASCVNKVLDDILSSKFEGLSLIQKTKKIFTFLEVSQKLFFLTESEVRLVDIRSNTIYLSYEDSSFADFLVELSKKVDLLISFVAHKGNLG